MSISRLSQVAVGRGAARFPAHVQVEFGHQRVGVRAGQGRDFLPPSAVAATRKPSCPGRKPKAAGGGGAAQTAARASAPATRPVRSASPHRRPPFFLWCFGLTMLNFLTCASCSAAVFWAAPAAGCRRPGAQRARGRVFRFGRQRLAGVAEAGDRLVRDRVAAVDAGVVDVGGAGVGFDQRAVGEEVGVRAVGWRRRGRWRRSPSGRSRSGRRSRPAWRIRPRPRPPTGRCRRRRWCPAGRAGRSCRRRGACRPARNRGL